MASLYPCGYCEGNVGWDDKPICCDQCDIWYHESCLNIGVTELEQLANTSISWICCKCNTPNLSSFTFRSFDITTSNTFDELSNLNDSLDPTKFRPPFTSSPNKNYNDISSQDYSSINLTTSSKNSLLYPQKTKPTNLRILTINCQSIRNKTQELSTVLEYTKPDVVCGTESWLDESIGDSEIFPTNIYKVYRNDRNLEGGGVFVLVKNNILSERVKLPKTSCELCLVELKLKNTKHQIIGSFYMPHRDITSIKNMDTLIKPLINKNLTICGDFNCPDIDWENGIVTTGASNRLVQEELLTLTQEYSLTQIHQESTRVDNILDLVITSNPSLLISSKSAPGISDHDLVISDFNIKIEYLQTPKRHGLNFNKADWQKISDYLNKELVKSLSINDDMNTLWIELKNHIKTAVEKFVPSYVIKPNYSLPWLSNSLKKCLKKKNRLYTKAKKSGKGSPKWAKYKEQQKQCKNLLKEAESDYVNNKINTGLLQNNTKPLWQYIKSKKQDHIGVSPLRSDGQLFSDPKQKAELLVTKFQEVFSTPITSALDEPAPVCPAIKDLHISKEGVEKLLASLDSTKANGPDEIPTLILKKCASVISPILTTIFQKSVETGVLPTDWRSANVTAIFKKGDRHDPNNYRPVSLTSVCSKVLEHIIHKHVVIHFEQNKILTELNHGFRKHYSCETQLITTIHDLATSFDTKTQVDIAILDFSKAFDKVPHRELLHKLKSYGINGCILQWISSFLCERNMRVMVDGIASRKVPVLSGVPQGTVLGPLLFLAHINDLPAAVKSQVRLFADDCLLYREIESRDDHHVLQSDLKALEKWAEKWGMQFNASKCTILSQNQKSTHFYTLDNEILRTVDHHPYLGVELSSDLKWTNHISKVIAKANSTLGLLKRNMKNCSEDCKRLAYCAMIRTQLEYACPVWDPHLQKDINSLESVQRRAARFITNDYYSKTPGDMTKMLKRLNLEPLHERRKTKRLEMFSKIVKKEVPPLPPDKFLKQMNTEKRKIKPKNMTGFNFENIVQNYATTNPTSFERIVCQTTQRSNSYFPRTIIQWNQLDSQQALTLSLRHTTKGSPGGQAPGC